MSLPHASSALKGDGHLLLLLLLLLLLSRDECSLVMTIIMMFQY
jgi:hypothetical protein